MTAHDPAHARAFRHLHDEGVLLLANCWDAGSARLVESLGAKALATTSAGVAWSHGYADGDCLPVPLLIATVAEIARVVRVPLSVDVEGGYSSAPAAVGEVVSRVIEAGGVGINIEDGTGPPDLLCAKIEEAKRAGARRGVDLFVNARTDVYLSALAPPERRVEETLARTARYREAGADGIFVPGVTDPAEIQAIAAAARLPLNVLVRPGLPPAARLKELGVRRLSTGSWVASALLGRAKALVGGFLADGNGDPLYAGALPYAETNGLFGSR